MAAVFGYCASSVFALALAERIADWQPKPQVLLFDPTAITGPTVLRYGFHRVIDSLAAVLGAEAVEQARAEAAAATERQPELLPLTEEFLRIYRAAGQAAFEKLGLGADRAEELVAWFRSYLHYVVAAGSLTVAPDLTGVTTIRANDLPAGFLQAPGSCASTSNTPGCWATPKSPALSPSCSAEPAPSRPSRPSRPSCPPRPAPQHAPQRIPQTRRAPMPTAPFDQADLDRVAQALTALPRCSTRGWRATSRRTASRD